MTLKGIIGATATVALTTADDAVWLVRYVASPSLPLPTRMIHAIFFVATLECLAIGCVIAAFLLKKTIGDEDTFIMGIVGAAICWILAICLYVRKVIKKRRRATRSSVCVTEYGAVDENERENASHADNDSLSSSLSSKSTHDEDAGDLEQPSIWTVVTLTTIGALDEISYFPGLLIGGVFSPFELCAGTLLASLIVLVGIGCFIARFKPLLKILDKIPLYGIICVFAIVLTTNTIYDLLKEEHFDG